MFRNLAAILLILTSCLAQAGVNPRNGNFYISYTDYRNESGGHTLEVKRTYNSQSTYAGWFGMGWGTPFEMRLTVMPDGSAVITEVGGGANSYFHDESRPRDMARIEQGVARIVQAARARDKLSADAAAALSKKLMADEEARLAAVRKYGVSGELSPEVTLSAVGYGYCAGTLRRTDTGYQRDNGCGQIADFDAQQRLVRLTESDGYRLDLRYEGAHPVELSDTDGKRLRLSWNPQGQVAQMETEQTCNDKQGKHPCRATYSYDLRGNLIESRDVEGNHYRYEYDDRSNMTHIRYVDGSHADISYDASDAVTSLTLRTGEHEFYEYSTDPADPEHTYTQVRKVSADGEETTRRFEYGRSRTASGERGASRYVEGEGINQATTEVDEKGRITRKVLGDGRYIEYRYDPVSGKVAAVKLNGGLSARYRYNSEGDVSHADSSDGLSVDFRYDALKHITEMRTRQADGRRHVLRIKYNAADKPIELRQDKLAPISVKYDDDGEISDVQSPNGAEAALAVTQTFQTLLAILNMAKLP